MRFAYPAIDFDAQTILHFAEIFQSGWVSNSEHVRNLEKHFIEKFNVKYAIACCNATQGLSIALTAADWKNKKVLVPAFTWPSTVYAIERNSCIPVYADINAETWAIDVNSSTEKFDAVVPVDIFGNMVEPELLADIPVIYDAAHGYGLPRLGHRGLAEVVSMSHTKYPTASEGGILLTNDPTIAKNATELRRLAARMSEFNAIIGLNSIRNYEHWRIKRNELIQHYLDEIKHPFDLQKIPHATNNSVFALLFEPELRNRIVNNLTDKLQLEIKVYYEPLARGLKNTEYVFSRILALPTHMKMFEIIDDVIKCINNS